MNRPLAAALLTLSLALSGCVGITGGDIGYPALETRYAGPDSRWMDMPDGAHVRYRDQGPPGAPALVMIHGFGASLETWEPWVARLSDRWRIITLDLPGHGLTRVPAGYRASVDGYADLADSLAVRLGVSRYVVIGNSLGGAAAWDDALRHIDHVRGLVLVDAAGWPGDHHGGAPAAAALMKNPIGGFVLDHVDARPMVTSGLRTAYVDPALVTPQVVDRYVDFSRAPGHRALLLRLRGRPAAPVRPETFKAIAVPTLILHGEKDALVPIADARAFAAAIPGAKLVTFAGVGHLPMEQAPDASATIVRAFLAGLDSPSMSDQDTK